MTEKEKYDFIDHVVHLALVEEDRLLNEYGGKYSRLKEDGIDSNEYYRIITERVINILRKNKYMQEELVSKDLEIEINKEIINLHTSPCYDELKAFALHFIEWQKEKMMAKAVDGYVIEDVEEGNGDFLLSADYLPKSMGLKDQQRVKVIVIKEE